MPTADEMIAALDLQPHPEGGFFRETWRHPSEAGQRGAGTAIYFLLRAGDAHRWHRIDATEIWHHYAGSPLALWVADGELTSRHVLGPDFQANERPQRIVPPGAWQRAESLGAYTLVGCTVSPAFVFDTFEIAPPGWQPPETS